MQVALTVQKALYMKTALTRIFRLVFYQLIHDLLYVIRYIATTKLYCYKIDIFKKIVKIDEIKQMEERLKEKI